MWSKGYLSADSCAVINPTHHQSFHNFNYAINSPMSFGRSHQKPRYSIPSFTSTAHTIHSSPAKTSLHDESNINALPVSTYSVMGDEESEGMNNARSSYQLQNFGMDNEQISFGSAMGEVVSHPPAEVQDTDSEGSSPQMNNTNPIHIVTEVPNNDLDDLPPTARKFLSEIRSTGVIPVVPRFKPASIGFPRLPPKMPTVPHNYPLIYIGDGEDETPACFRSLLNPQETKSMLESEQQTQPSAYSHENDMISEFKVEGHSLLGQRRKTWFNVDEDADQLEDKNFYKPSKLVRLEGQGPASLFETSLQTNSIDGATNFGLGSKRGLEVTDSPNDSHGVDLGAPSSSRKRIMREMSPCNVDVFYEDGYEESLGW